MTAVNREQQRCPGCGIGIGFDTEVCSHCGHGAFFDPPRLHEGREVSVVERVMLTMLYSEDREPRWWQRPGRIIFLVSTAAIGYLIWLSMAPSP